MHALRRQALTVVITATLMLVGVESRASAADEGLAIAGNWTPEGVPGAALRTYIATGSRVIYIVSGNGTWLRAYDVDTFAPLAPAVTLPAVPASGLVDQSTGDILFGGVGANAVSRWGIRNGVITKVASATLPLPISPFSKVLGMHLGPRGHLLWLLVSTGGSSSEQGVTLVEMDYRKFSTGQSGVNWVNDLADDGCPTPITAGQASDAGLGYVPGTRSLYFGCTVPAAPPAYQSPQGSGVGRLELLGDPEKATTPGVLRRYIRSGEFGTGDSFVDAPAGRVTLSAYSPSAGGSTLYVFDAFSGRFIGKVTGSTNDFIASGVDPVSGRLYGTTQDRTKGLMAAELRATPPNQPRLLPAASTGPNNSLPAASTLPSDPFTRRVFLSYVGRREIVIVHDALPPLATLPADDPDVGTADIAEDPLRTRSVFSGAAQGYGSRYRSVGGPENLFFNLTNVNVGDGQDRELRGAFLTGLTLTNDEASGSNIALDADSSAKSAGWQYEPAQCSDFGDAPRSATTEGAEVRCDAGAATVMAKAEAGQTSSGGFTVERSEHVAEVRRDRSRGTVVTVTSRADGISAAGTGGLLRIGQVRVVSQAWAAGRSGTAGYSFTREVSDVTFNGTEQCEDVCTTRELAELADTLAKGRFKVELPEPAPGRNCRRTETSIICDGSPRGYQGLLQREQMEQLEQVIISNQPIDRVEVPGMVLSFVTDNQRTSRTILELAGTAAEARYGIVVIANGEPGYEGALAPILALQGEGRMSGDQFGQRTFGAPSEPSSARRSSGARSAVRAVLGFAFGGLTGLIRLSPVWAILLAPIYLSARRALLLRRGQLLPGSGQ